MNENVLFKEESYAIVGAMLEVHRQLGPGLNEKIYQEALALEFSARSIPFEREKHLPVYYRDVRLSVDYIADFVCYDNIIVELKSVDSVLPIHKAQVINYLRITKKHLGILVNFNALKLEPLRLVN